MTQSTVVLEKSLIGSRNILILQDNLQRLNLNVGAIDGIFGPKTEAAVIQFQQSYNYLAHNGIVDTETILQLDKALWLKDREIIREGCKGEEVQILQSIFVESNYALIDIDGIFSKITKAIVSDFQKTRNLQADGIVGEYTWGCLYDASWFDFSDADRLKIFFGEYIP